MHPGRLICCLVAALAITACSEEAENPPQDDSGIHDAAPDDLAPRDGSQHDVTIDAVGQHDAPPDVAAPDMPAVDAATPDQAGPDMPVADAATPDQGGPDMPVTSGNGSCANAATIPLVGGVGTVIGNTKGNANEFSAGVKCMRFSTTLVTMIGPQAYFKFSGQAGQLYRITTTTTFLGGHTYVFTNSACTAAAINADCQSNGAAGIVSTKLSAHEPESIYFKPSSAGDVYVVVDSAYSNNPGGAFTLRIEAIATPTNITCSKAQHLTFTNGKAAVTGDLSHLLAPDEFPNLNCSNSTKLDGPNLYYTFAASAGMVYRMRVTSKTIDSTYMYYVTTTSCSTSQLASDCQSGGKSGDGYASAGTGGTSRLYYVPSSSGTVTVGIDNSSGTVHGQFGLLIEAFKIPTNKTCNAAQLVTLAGGKAVIKGDTTPSSDEFSTLTCKTVGYSSTKTSALDGAQLYYSWATLKDQWYKLTLTPKDSPQYLYVFTSSACTAAALEASCQSSGASGYALGLVAAGTSEALYWKAPSNGTAKFAVDSTFSDGEFEVTLEAFTLPANGTCAKAKTIVLVGGKGSAAGDTSPDITPDEFPQVSCFGSALALDGPQAYYQVALQANQNYRISITAAAGDRLRGYIFTNTCSPALIKNHCNSSGNVISYAYPGETKSVIFKPSAAGTYKIAVDSTAPWFFGAHTVTVKAVP